MELGRRVDGHEIDVSGTHKRVRSPVASRDTVSVLALGAELIGAPKST